MDMRSGEQADMMSRALAQNWWAIAIRGVLGIAVGLTALVLPAATMLALVLLFAAYMLADGIFAIIAAVRAARRSERWGLMVLEGAVDILAGVLAVLWPGLTVIAFVLLVAAWAVVSGILLVAAAINLNIEQGRWWLILGGLVSVAYGALLIVTPLLGALVLTWWFGAYALLFGILLLVLAFKLRAHREDRPRAMAAQRAA
jgi:uncharacterized membrane protein HdeD (DUF308 family)